MVTTVTVDATAAPEPTIDVMPAAAIGRRSRALDVLRGLVMVGLAVLIFTPTTGWRGHAEWWGWRPPDAFFPAFLFVAGAGLALQTRRGFPWPRLLRRFVALVAIGLLVNAVLGAGLDLGRLRIPGVLQRIAIVGLAGAVGVRLTGRRWAAVALAAVTLAAAWGGLLHVAAADCPDNEPSSDGACATFQWVDEAVFGTNHIYWQGTRGHDPEGLASTLGALATFLAGFSAAVVAGNVATRPPARRAMTLLALGAGWLVLTPAALWLAPFGKRLWTPAFVTVNAAVALAVWAALVMVFDRETRARPVGTALAALAWPFQAVGRNALVLWVALFFVDHALAVTTSHGRPLGDHLVATHGAGWYLAVFGGTWLATAMAMHAARWHVRL